MKTFKNFIFLCLISLFAVSCNRDFDTPPFPEPHYVVDDESKLITVAKLKELYVGTTSVAPSLIDVDVVLRAYVIGNDESGNIFKQLYVQDETGGLSIGIDQNGLAPLYKIGQELYFELKGLYVVSYGGELQIGYVGTNANRISPLMFEEHTFYNSWPLEKNAKPKPVKMDALTDDMVNTLVQLDNVYFVNGGKNAFTTDDKTTNEVLKDGAGKQIDVRTSQYARFAKEKLPSGSGTLIGILGRYNGGWQFTMRSLADAKNFGGDIPTKPEPEVGIVFLEGFGTGTIPSTPRPTIATYTDYDMKAPITFTGLGAEDLRGSSTLTNHVWLKAKADGALIIKGINTIGKSNLKLSYDMTANVYNDGETANVNNLKVTYNGTTLAAPSVVLDKAGGYNTKYYSVTVDISSLPLGNDITLELKASATDNEYGLRLDNIKIFSGDGGSIIPTPVK